MQRQQRRRRKEEEHWVCWLGGGQKRLETVVVAAGVVGGDGFAGLREGEGRVLGEGEEERKEGVGVRRELKDRGVGLERWRWTVERKKEEECWRGLCVGGVVVVVVGVG